MGGAGCVGFDSVAIGRTGARGGERGGSGRLNCERNSCFESGGFDERFCDPRGGGPVFCYFFCLLTTCTMVFPVARPEGKLLHGHF